MKLKKRLKKGLLIIFALAPFCCASLQAQSLYIMKNNQSLLNYSTSNVKSISFNNGSMTVNNNGIMNEISLADIQHLSFVDYTNTTTIDKNSEEPSRLSCYPNPAKTELTIEMASTEGVVNIELLSASGQIVLKRNSKFYNNRYQLNVSSLECGIYLCKISTEDNIQMTSFIKQ